MTKPEWPENPEARWSPAEHYDMAFDTVNEIPTILGDGTIEDGQLAASIALTHALLGILRRLDQYTP